MRIYLMIKDYFKSHGINEQDLLQSCGFSPDKIKNITNNSSELNVEDYFMICKALHLDLDYFFEQWKKHRQ